MGNCYVRFKKMKDVWIKILLALSSEGINFWASFTWNEIGFIIEIDGMEKIMVKKNIVVL